MEAAHDRGLDKTHRPVHVVVLNSWNQNLLALLKQVLLDRSDVLNVADVLVEARVDGHMFGSHREAFSVLVLVLYIEHERDAGRVLGHHLFQEAGREVDSFDDKGFIALVEGFDDFGDLLGDQGALLLVALQGDPALGRVLPFFLEHGAAGFVRRTEQGRVCLLFQEVAHHVPH